jgi:hypothetical protein
MDKIQEKKVNDIIHTIGLNNNLRDCEVKEMVESQFRFMYERIKEMSLDNMTEEEIDKCKTNFFFKYLGKVHTSGEIVVRHKNKLNKIKEEKNERKIDGI